MSTRSAVPQRDADSPPYSFSFGAAVNERMFQAIFPLMFRLHYSSPALQFATKRIDRPSRITVPTRHGDVSCLVYKPTASDIDAMRAKGMLPPVHVQIHGGGFIIRRPDQEDNVARYLASEIGCYVVIADYDTAPSVRFPVSEEQNYDVFQWVHQHGPEQGWDGGRLTVGGASAGGKFALNVVELSLDAGTFVPLAVTIEYACCDLAMPSSEKTSPKRNPVVSPSLDELVKHTYFAGLEDPSIPLVSPSRYNRLAEFPPILITTAEYDRLRLEGNQLAEHLKALGVQVTHKEFAGVDHGYTHTPPVEVCREAIRLIGEQLRTAYEAAPAAELSPATS